MKKTFFFISILSILVSCSTPTDNDTENAILGEWVWIESSGGLAGTTETPESTNEIVRLIISDNSIKRIVNGSLKSDRGYIIERRKSVIYGDEREMIIYDNAFKQMYSTTGKALILIGDCNDCFVSRYERE